MSSGRQEQGFSSSSSSSERMTIAYSESPAIACSDSEATGSSGYSTSSASLDTPRSEQSFSSLFDAIKQTKERAEFFGYEPLQRVASLHGGPQLDGLEYFWSHNIFQLFCFMMSHLLAHTPDEPVAFLAQLVGRCLLYRDRGGDPPLLFEEPHVRSVYTALDPGGDGYIRYAQYVAGMKTLGLSEFNFLPGEVDYLGKDVEEYLFVSEARQALLQQLDSMLGCSVPAAISKDLVVDYRGSGGEGSSADDRSTRTVEDIKDTTSEEIMSKLKGAQGRGLLGLMSGHSIGGRSSLSSEQLVTKYMRKGDQDMPGFISSHSFTAGGEQTEFNAEFVGQKEEERSGITSSQTIGHIQSAFRDQDKVKSYDGEKSEVIQEMMSTQTNRTAASVGPRRTSEQSGLRGAEPSTISFKTSKQKIVRSGEKIEAMSKEQLGDVVN